MVTGGSGFIGTNVIDALLRNGVQVSNLDSRAPRNPAQIGTWTQVDLLDRQGVLAAVQAARPMQVIHLGARTDLDGSDLGDYAVNTEGTENLVAALASLEAPPTLVSASTRMVCEIGYHPRADDDYCPPNAYGESKVEGERILRTSGYPGTWTIVRPTSIWGPWFGVPYRDFFLAVAKGRYRHPRAARIRKSFGYVENTTHQIRALTGAPSSAIHGRVFYLADYEPIEVGDWANRIHQAAGGSPVRTVPLSVLRSVALVGDALKRVGWNEPPLTRFRLRNLLTEMLYDVEPVRSLAPDLPIALDLAVTRTVEWLRAQGDLPAAGQ
jgi:nucleoside-diphosphate-sugar epimerase